MRRAALVLAAALTMATPAHATPTQDAASCQQHHHWQHVAERDNLIWCVAHRLNAPGTPRRAAAIARCESGSDYQDTYGGDSHVGTFQHITSAWPGRWRTWGRPLGVPPAATNVWSQSVVSVRMAKADGSWSAQWACA